MTDREMLEFAAKAVGIPPEAIGDMKATIWIDSLKKAITQWNPLTDDGDAFRLAVKLSLHVRMWVYACEIETNDGVKFGLNHCGDFGGDVSKAARYAITRAAAEIGKRMP